MPSVSWHSSHNLTICLKIQSRLMLWRLLCFITCIDAFCIIFPHCPWRVSSWKLHYRGFFIGVHYNPWKISLLAKCFDSPNTSAVDHCLPLNVLWSQHFSLVTSIQCSNPQWCYLTRQGTIHMSAWDTSHSRGCFVTLGRLAPANP